MVKEKYLWIVFWGICALVAAALIFRAWSLRLLYIDPRIRERVKVTVEIVAQREGWLLSDVSLRAVVDSGILIHHRQHMRGTDPTECYFIPFDTPDLFPCAT